MQTFLTHIYDFEQNARTLDSKRLNKQLLEGRQIYAALTGRSAGWKNHPATKMWFAHENMLIEYLRAIKNECERRDIRTMNNWNALMEMHDMNYDRGDNLVAPHWMEDEEQSERIMLTHRGNLYKKDPIYYNQFADVFDTYMDYVCCERCNYFWVTHTYAKEFSHV